MWTLYILIPLWRIGELHFLWAFFGECSILYRTSNPVHWSCMGFIFLPGADCIGSATQWHRPDATAYPLACQNCGATSMVYDWNLSYSVRSLCLPFIWLTSYPRVCALSSNTFGDKKLKLYGNWRACRKMEINGVLQNENGTIRVQSAQFIWVVGSKNSSWILGML